MPLKLILTLFLIISIEDTVLCQTTEEFIDNTYESIDKQDFKTALMYCEKGRNVAEKEYGLKSSDYAEYLYLLGSIYRKTNQYLNAEKVLNESLKIIESNQQRNDSVYANILDALGSVYIKMEQFQKAESLCLKSSAIRKNTSLWVLSLNTLTQLYLYMGDYSKAESLCLEAIGIYRKEGIKEQYNYLNAINNLSYLYEKMGNFPKALKVLIEGKSELLSIENNLLNLTLLQNIGSIYLDMGDYPKAEKSLIETLNLSKELFGSDDITYGMNLNVLAVLYSRLNKFNESKKLIEEAIIIYKKTLGENHSAIASLYSTLSLNYFALGNFYKADSLNNIAIDILKNSFSSNNSNISIFLENWAVQLWGKGDYIKSGDMFLKSQDIINGQIRLSFTFLSGQEKQTFMNTISSKFEVFNSFLYNCYLLQPQLSITSYNNELQNKGLILHSTNEVINIIQKNGDTAMLNNLDKLSILKRQLEIIYRLPNNEYPANLNEMENEAENLDKELVRKSQAYKQYKQQLNVTWQSVQQKLKPNEAAIEFISFRNFSNHWSDSLLYGALVLRPGYKYPKFVYLFEQQQLNSLLKSGPNNDSSLINDLYSNSASKNKLNSLIWQPLDSLLQEVKTIYAAPSGILNSINLAAIPINADSTFGTKYNLHILGTTADVINYSPLQINKNTIDNAYLFGGIDYDKANTSNTLSINSTIDNNIGFEQIATSSDRGYIHSWGYLPGTLKEGSEIQTLFNIARIKTSLLTGRDASESNFKNLSGSTKPFILHLATHGYFFPDTKKEKPKEIAFIVENRGAVYKSSENPLLRSGLILAGANKAWSNDNYKSDSTEDGILTAYEVSNTDLSKAQLVVMSACETGLGDINGSEGVFGLQRGFKLAGAKDIIMSLWKVPDAQTSELLTLFYTNCLKGKSVPEALQSAQLQMQKKYPPYYWAAFKLLE